MHSCLLLGTLSKPLKVKARDKKVGMHLWAACCHRGQGLAHAVLGHPLRGAGWSVLLVLFHAHAMPHTFRASIMLPCNRATSTMSSSSGATSSAQSRSNEQTVGAGCERATPRCKFAAKCETGRSCCMAMRRAHLRAGQQLPEGHAHTLVQACTWGVRGLRLNSAIRLPRQQLCPNSALDLQHNVGNAPEE